MDSPIIRKLEADALLDAAIDAAVKARIDSLRGPGRDASILTSTTDPAPTPEPDYVRVEYPQTEGGRTRIYVHLTL
jgi:hypothetical protein